MFETLPDYQGHFHLDRGSRGVFAEEPEGSIRRGGLAQTVALYRLRSPEGTPQRGSPSARHSSGSPRGAGKFHFAESQTPKNGACANHLIWAVASGFQAALGALGRNAGFQPALGASRWRRLAPIRTGLCTQQGWVNKLLVLVVC